MTLQRSTLDCPDFFHRSPLLKETQLKQKISSERLARLLKMAYCEDNLSVLSLTEYQLKENKISINSLVFHPPPPSTCSHSQIPVSFNPELGAALELVSKFVLSGS